MSYSNNRINAPRGRVRNINESNRSNRSGAINRGPTDRPRKKNNKKGIYLVVIIVSALAVCIGSIFIIKAVINSNSKTDNAQTAEERPSRNKDTKTSKAETEATAVAAAETMETTPTTTETTVKETQAPKTGWQGSDAAGWRYYLTDTIYFCDTWENINGKWHYFNSDGIMEHECYRDGYWIDKDGVRDPDSAGEWKENDEGRWYEDNSEAWYEEYGYTWYPSDMGLWIDGEYYWFDSDGYLDPDITSPEEAARIIAARDAEDDED